MGPETVTVVAENGEVKKVLESATKEETPKPKQLSRKEIGQLRRAYITVVNPTVIKCGHKLHKDKAPNNNCIYCWEAFFHTIANLEELIAALRGLGLKKFTAKYGTKFAKNFRGFVGRELMRARAEQQAEPTEVKAEDGETVQIEGSTLTSTELQETSCELNLQTSTAE